MKRTCIFIYIYIQYIWKYIYLQINRTFSRHAPIIERGLEVRGEVEVAKAEFKCHMLTF